MKQDGIVYMNNGATITRVNTPLTEEHHISGCDFCTVVLSTPKSNNGNNGDRHDLKIICEGQEMIVNGADSSVANITFIGDFEYSEFLNNIVALVDYLKQQR